MTAGYQTQVYPASAPGVAGDFAGLNPVFSLLAGPGGLIAGVGGVTVGKFAWTYPPVDGVYSAKKVVQNYGAGSVEGFVHRAQQGMIITYLADASMVIQPGFQMALCNGGDFLVKNDGTTAAEDG